MDADYNQEYRSYGSYVSRVIAIIVAFALLVVAVWFVVRLASNDDEPTIGDSTRNVIALDENVLDEDQPTSGDNQDEVAPASDDSQDDQSSQPDQTDQADQDTATAQDDGQATNTQDDANNNVAAADDSDNQTTPETGGHVLSTNTDELPSTGGELGVLVFLPVLAYFASKRMLVRDHR